MKKLLFMLSVVAIGLVSCKKESRIEKNLWKKGGEWNISSYSNEYYYALTGFSGVDSCTDCGVFSFSKDGSGFFIFNIDGESNTASFQYTNTENELILTQDGESITYQLDWEKDYLKLKIDEEYINPDGTKDFDRLNISLTKK